MARPKRLYKWTELPDDVSLVHAALSDKQVLDIREALITAIWTRDLRAFYKDGTTFQPTVGHVSVLNPPHLALADGQRWLERTFPALSWSPDLAAVARARVGPSESLKSARQHQRQDLYYQMMVDSNLLVHGEIPRRLPKGTGDVAESLGVSRQYFTKELQKKFARMRLNTSAKCNQNNE